MEPYVFLSAVLPSTGKYCLATIDPGTPPTHKFVDTQEELYRHTDLLDTVGHNVYMALANYDNAGRRQQINAQYMRCFFADIDCGVNDKGQPKAYPSKSSAIVALHKFLSDTGLDALGQPWLVDSGGGVHVYWPLDKDVPTAAWKVVAEQLKRTTYALGFKIDYGVTIDSARVLRMPGTRNRKYTPERTVTLRNIGGTFSLTDIATCLSKLTPAANVQSPVPALSSITGTPIVGPMSAVATALLANSKVRFKDILTKTVAGTGCGQIKFYIDNAQQDGLEPLWRACLSIAKPCTDGLKAATVLSQMHPYDTARMQTKLSEIKGPYPCAKFDAENPGVCTACVHWGKITNPLALGRVMDVVTTESVIEVGDDDLQHTVTRPVPPRGFSFGRQGGVFFQETEIDAKTQQANTIEKMLLPFDFFMLDTMVEDGVYSTRFMAIRNGKKNIIVIPNKAVSNKDATATALASQNIVASFGAGNDKNLFNYVRACIAEASTVDNAMIVPPNYGWQADGSFALGDTTYRQDGDHHTFASNRLANLISVTTPRGTIEDWASVMRMLMRKGLWGQIACMAMSFGSALKHFTPAGSRAFTFHIASKESGIGKTLALSISNSVWGDPTNFSVKPATSERTMLQRAGMLGSLPLNIDEVTNKVRAGNGEWMPNHIFDFSQGGHKLKGMGASNAEMRDDLHWESNSILTSNAPVMEALLGARDTTSNGEAYRLLEWRGLGQRLEWAVDERETLQLLNKNFGVAGQVWAQWLVQNQVMAQVVVADALEKWRELVHAPDEERFWTAGAASALAALHLIGPQHANILKVPLSPIKDFFKLRVQEARRIINTNRQYASDLLNAFVREHHGGFVKLAAPSATMAIFADGREVRPDSTKGSVRGRVEYDAVPGWTDFYIEVRLLKEYCAKRNKSYIEFVQELQTRSSVTEVRKDLLAKTKGPSLRVVCLKISQRNEDLEP